MVFQPKATADYRILHGAKNINNPCIYHRIINGDIYIFDWRIVREKQKLKGRITMLKDILTVELQGGIFRTPQRLSILSKNGTPAKASLIYGRNGSGKSTIAKAFKTLTGEACSTIQVASVYDTNNAPMQLAEEDKTHIFVFDEDFVNKNVRIQEDGLNSIVMLGEQVDLVDLIKKTTAELSSAEAERDQKKNVVDEFNNAASNK